MAKKATFGDRLRECRTAKGLTQQGLADAIGMTQEYVARLEKNRQSPSWDTVQKLAEALDVSCEAFKEKRS